MYNQNLHNFIKPTDKSRILLKNIILKSKLKPIAIYFYMTYNYYKLTSYILMFLVTSLCVLYERFRGIYMAHLPHILGVVSGLVMAGPWFNK